MGKIVSAGNANTGYRAGRPSSQRGPTPPRSAYARALSDSTVRLGYALTVVGLCMVGPAVWLAGGVGLLLLPASLGMFILSVLRHVIVAWESVRR